MSIQIKVPSLGESVTEATVAKWYKAEGDGVAQDELLAELETDKVTLEVNAPASGVLKKIVAAEGADVEVGALMGEIEEGAAPAQKAAPQKTAASTSAANDTKSDAKNDAQNNDVKHGPAAEKLMREKGLDPKRIEGSGKDGRVTKGDVLNAGSGSSAGAGVERKEERVKMTKLRQVIAKRLKESQDTAAILTTFNEIDMGNVMALRREYKEAFEKKHGLRLGFMGFFAKAVTAALQEFPSVNAEIQGNEIVYKNYCDIGVAVGTDQGLVVPIVRDADKLSIAGIEGKIAELAGKARKGSLSMSELQGGTFTISNGGVYGSLLSTPIINPPQSGILGLHKIEERPIAQNGQVVIRPMMYIALSYDHRIIDGSESVRFLVKVKEAMETPARLLLEV